MKSFLIILSVVLFLFSCEGKKEEDPGQVYVPADAETMAVSLNFIHQENALAAQDTAPETQISAPADSTETYKFTVKYNSRYCGGARPPEELLEELEREKPLVNSVIQIVDAGKKGLVYEVKTDAKGRAEVKLPEGKWSYSLTENLDESLPVNKNCDKALNYVYGNFTAKKGGKTSFKLFYHFTCDPCDPNIHMRQ